MKRPVERSLAPEFSIVDIIDDLIWHRDGRLSLCFRLVALHEPSLSEEDFNQVAASADDVWSSGLPEGTGFQFLVLVDQRRGVETIEEVLPPIHGEDVRSQVLEEFRRMRIEELTRVDESTPGTSFVQARQHYLVATFTPAGLRRGWYERLRSRLRRPRADKWQGIYETAMAEASRFHHRVEYGLLQLGLGFERCQTRELVSLVHELLNPTASRVAPLDSLSGRARLDRDGFPQTIVKRLPYLSDTSPVWSLLEDDLVVRREYLEVGDRFVGIVSLKSLPDRTEPGLLVPLLHLARSRYVVSYQVDIPQAGLEAAALKAKARWAAGLKLQNFLVKSDRTDMLASAVQEQSDEALAKIIASTQRVLGTTLQIVLYEASPEDLEEGIQQVLAVMARAHGLRGHRETYLLQSAFLSLLPGAPPMANRRRKTLTSVAVDFMPFYSFRFGKGKIPFLTPTNSAVLYDPFDRSVTSNSNVLVTGTSGSGKSFLVSVLLSGYELACAAAREPPPYTFILDNGDSYSRYAQITHGRAVSFTFDEPPGCDIFAWNETAGTLDAHVSRLEWLLLDLLRVSDRDEERFEAIKAVIEQALKQHLYGSDLPKTFQGFQAALARVNSDHAASLGDAMYPFIAGKFARLFEPNPRLAMRDDVHVTVYDFKGLEEHRDLAAIALRLTIYEVRRWAARVKKRHSTFLVLDESWALLDAGTGGASIAATAAPFIAASVRMGRKEGMSVIGLSQQIEDFASSPYGAAILGNSATKFVGAPGGEGLAALQQHLRLTERQADQVRRLKKSPRYHEFLMVRGDNRSDVVRVPGDPFSRWVFTTDAEDRKRIAATARAHPQLSLFEQMQLLAAEG